MPRRSVAVTSLSFTLGLLVVALLSPADARAQGMQNPGAWMPIPLTGDLKRAAPGQWSEYRIADQQNTLVVRMALVARLGDTAQIETKVKGGPVAALGDTTLRMLLPLDGADLHPSEQVIQFGDNPPMSLPVDSGAPGTQHFKKVDPKKRIGVESVKVKAGTFARADHYQDKGRDGQTVDYWVASEIRPFGLIKMTAASAGGAPVTMELVAHGGGAKPIITKAPRPFDPQAMMKMIQPALAGAGAGAPGGGGPPPQMAPSPHPGMPPVPVGNAGASHPTAPRP